MKLASTFFCHIGVLILYLISSPLYANGMFTTGTEGNQYSIFSGSNNPAMGDLVVPEDEKWRMNIMPSLGASMEVGKVDNFVEELEDLADLVDDPSLSTDSVQDTLDRFNSVLEVMGEEGYLNFQGRFNAPISPLYFRSERLHGTVFTELTFDTVVSMRVLDDELTFDRQNGSYATNTSLYLKGATETRLALGYSRQLDFASLSPYMGNFYGGVKINFTRMELSKQVLALTQLDGEDIGELVRDDFDKNIEETTAVGIDIGLVWDRDKFRTGLTLSSINSPSYKYGAVGEDCTEILEASVSRSNCEVARYYTQVKGELVAREKHRQHMRFTLDALYKISSRWYVNGMWEPTDYEDSVGNEHRWMRISTLYEPKNAWIPSTRFGYQKNFAGSKLSALGIGFTFFKGLLLDIQYGTEKVTVDDVSTPRTFGFFLGFQEQF